MNNEINNTPAAVETPAKKRKNLRTLKRGSYIIIISAIVLAAVIALNLFVSALPASFINIDLTENSMFTLSDETRSIVEAVDTDINMYIIIEAQAENSATETVRSMLARYSEINSHIKVSTVDPGVQPQFTSQYTDETVSPNSVIVVSDKRSQVVDASDLYMYVTDYGNFSTSEYEYYANYGYDLGGKLNYFGEMYYTGAISYVTDENIPVVYMLSGHGESELADSAQSAVTSENIKIESLSLLTSEIPEDCGAIIINQPEYDISEDEYNALDSYISSGGNILMMTDLMNYSAEKMPNLAAIAEKMGMKAVDGIVIETSTNGYSQYPYNIVPSIGTQGPASLLSSENVAILIYGGSHGIISTDTSEATVYPLLSTSSNSYVKASGVQLSTFEKEDGDYDGPVYLGAASVLSSSDEENAPESKFVWFSSPDITSSSLAKGNLDMFTASLNWMCDKETSISIIGREISSSMLEGVTAASAGLWSNIMIGLIPLAVLVSGFAVWFRRRRK